MISIVLVSGVEVIEGASVYSYCSSGGNLTAVRLVNVDGECVTVPCQVRAEMFAAHGMYR